MLNAVLQSMLAAGLGVDGGGHRQWGRASCGSARSTGCRPCPALFALLPPHPGEGDTVTQAREVLARQLPV
ncbi:hypothetical protein M3I53_23575 [Paraburkholderia sp. CNPSo 3272]|nr:hypothetical protein [Paraburkholderia sp. CNPSo 3272]MCP3726071.1 hypothetical protein [Paraburkholderia sp. CNPSo 3272]